MPTTNHVNRAPVEQSGLIDVEVGTKVGIEHLSLNRVPGCGEETLELVTAVVDSGHVHRVQDGEATTPKHAHEIVALAVE